MWEKWWGRLNVAISQLLAMRTIYAVLCQDFEIQMPLFHSKTVIDVNPGYRLSILKLNKCYVYISNLFTLLWNFAWVVFIIATNVLTCVTEKSLYSIFQMHSFYCDCLNLYTTCRLKIYANHGCTAYASLLLKIGLFVSKSPLST